MSSTEYNEFIQRFKVQAQELEDGLSTKTPSNNGLEQISSGVTKLRISLTEAIVAGILPAYDQRLCEERTIALEELLSKARLHSKPKSKFSFKSAANARLAPSSQTVLPTGHPSSISDTWQTSNSESTQSTGNSTAEISLANYTHRYLTFQDAVGANSANTIGPKQSLVVTVRALSNCLVDLTKAPTAASVNAVHVQGLRRTVLYTGSVQGSILLHDCRECTIVVSSHQFRMHTSHSTHVYLQVSSHPVIEKCTEIGFGSFSPGTSSTASANEITTPVPYTIMDFDWVGETQSPNWYAIEGPGFCLSEAISEDELDTVLSAMLPRTAL